MNSNEREQLMEIRRWSRIQREMEETAARNHISPGESKNEKRLREDIDFLLSLIDGQPDAAIRMRDACLGKVKTLPDHPATCGVWLQQGCSCSFRAEVIAALKSLTLDQVEQKQ